MALDSPVQRDGDRGFIGFASRMNPLTLPPGMLQLSENMRLDRGVAQVRKGATRLATGISIADSPLVLPFTLSGDNSVSSITRSSTTATATSTAHGYTSGDVVNIRGADQSEYNGDFTVTVVDADTFTYTVSGSPATPARGTIVAIDGPIVKGSEWLVKEAAAGWSIDMCLRAGGLLRERLGRAVPSAATNHRDPPRQHAP